MFAPEIEAAFEGDIFGQAVADTLYARGNLTLEQSIAAVNSYYSYDVLAHHVIDYAENKMLEELANAPVVPCSEEDS